MEEHRGTITPPQHNGFANVICISGNRKDYLKKTWLKAHNLFVAVHFVLNVSLIRYLVILEEMSSNNIVDARRNARKSSRKTKC